MTQTEQKRLQTSSFVGQFSCLMCPHLVRLLKLKRLLQYIYRLNLAFKYSHPHKTEIRTHMMLFRLVLLSVVLNHTTHIVTGAVQGTAPLSDISI